MSEYFRTHIKKQHYPAHPSTIKFWTQFRNCVLESLRKREWKEVGHDCEWDICWVEKETVQDLFNKVQLLPNQKINHFRNHFELTRKDLFIKNVKRHRKILEKEGKLDEAASYDFIPTTYNLPNEYSIFTEEFKRSNNNIWIMKPIGKSQGKGIFLFKKLSQISEWKSELKFKEEGSQAENYIVQRYIANPLLIGGKKFDMRIYCLVTSYSPLTAYLYRDGFARFTHHRYDNTDISNCYVHLTNVAIQKHSENYDKKLGGKWDLRTLKLYLASKYGQDKVAQCFFDIQQVIIKTLQSVQKVILNDRRCFELYGFDILLDANLKAWVLEVNGSPSMTANTKQDSELKCALLDDVFTILDLEKILTNQDQQQIGGFDLIYKGTPIMSESSINPSMLGSQNNRDQQLKNLAKMTSFKLSQDYAQTREETLTDIQKVVRKDTPQMIGNNTITDLDSAAKKLRSRSIGKTYRSPTLGPTILKAPAKNIFKPRPPLEPIRDARESREARDSKDISPEQRPRLYKGRTIDLPPVNNSLSFTNSHVDTNPKNITQSYNSQKPSTSNDTTGYAGNNTSTTRVSTGYSQATTSETSFKQIQQKPSYDMNLSGSLSLYTIRAPNKQTIHQNVVTKVPILLNEPSAKGKTDKSTPANKQIFNVYDYDINKSSFLETRFITEDLVASKAKAVEQLELSANNFESNKDFINEKNSLMQEGKAIC